jgi:hypothetical protein
MHKCPERASLKQNSPLISRAWVGETSSVSFVPGDAVFLRRKEVFAGCVKIGTGNCIVWSMAILPSFI